MIDDHSLCIEDVNGRRPFFSHLDEDDIGQT